MKNRFDFKDNILYIAEMLEPVMLVIWLQEISNLIQTVSAAKRILRPRRRWKWMEGSGDGMYQFFWKLWMWNRVTDCCFGSRNYWCHVLNLKNSAGQLCYQNLRKCISLLFCLLVSNASSERVFSALKIIKGPKRNRLEDITVSSLMRIKGWLKRNINTPILSSFRQKCLIPSCELDLMLQWLTVAMTSLFLSKAIRKSQFTLFIKLLMQIFLGFTKV